MNIAVCIKQTPDTTTRVQVADSGNAISHDGVTWIINPYDEFAIEEALQLTEKHGGEVTLISLGPATLDKTIREGLAMGAHKAIRLNADSIPADPLVTAKALAEVLKAGSYDLIFCGKQAIDDDHAQMASLLSQLLAVPTISSIVNLEVEGDTAKAKREVEGGYEHFTLPLPAIIGAHRHLNEPRYRSLKGIMQAKKKPIDVQEANLAEAQLVVEKLEQPPAKSEGRILGEGAEAVPELIRLLREEAKVI